MSAEGFVTGKKQEMASVVKMDKATFDALSSAMATPLTGTFTDKMKSDIKLAFGDDEGAKLISKVEKAGDQYMNDKDFDSYKQKVISAVADAATTIDFTPTFWKMIKDGGKKFWNAIQSGDLSLIGIGEDVLAISLIQVLGIYDVSKGAYNIYKNLTGAQKTIALYDAYLLYYKENPIVYHSE